jgi:hypothetical protein
MRSPGSNVKSIVVVKSAPASPGFAYVGSGTDGSVRVIRTFKDFILGINLKIWIDKG